MTETSKTSTSSFLIAINPEERENRMGSFTQESVDMKVPLIKAKSFTQKQNEPKLYSGANHCEENEEQMEGMSLIEESYSYLTQGHPGHPLGNSCAKARKGGKKYNRKEKSLGELCKKFIYLYGAQNYCIIALDECTYTLGVERRRIYDIINILESFNVLSRLAKNQYEWRGIGQIETSIQRMRGSPIDEVLASPLKKRKKKKSLGILCESFIKQFLTWRSTISLEQAARRISDDQIDESKLKTKVRRLYDIANVLAALNLIEKTSLETRKPAFKWVGEQGLQVFIQEMEHYFLENNVSGGEPTQPKINQLSSFDFKTAELPSAAKSRGERPVQRLNSGSTCTSFKNTGTLEEREFTFSNLNSNCAAQSGQDAQGGDIFQNRNVHDQPGNLVQLLEKLSINQLSHPMYKPTPIYPINHYLSNSCTELRTTFLDKLCEDLLEKYKENKLNITFDSQYQTPIYNKVQSERFGSSTTFESENQVPDGRDSNMEDVRKDLQMQWSQVMKEFDVSSAQKQPSEVRGVGANF